jgi:hypothetical protein
MDAHHLARGAAERARRQIEFLPSDAADAVSGRLGGAEAEGHDQVD